MKGQHEELEGAHDAQVSPIAAHPSARTRSDSWRVFCAIDLPESVHESFRQHIARLREIAPQSKVGWARDSNIHLTLKFLGETQQSRVLHLSQAAARVVRGLAPFKIFVEHTGSFPKLGAPRILWIGVNDESGDLNALQGHLEDECAKEGFSKEDRPFHPHLTIARLRLPRDERALAAAHKKMGFEAIEVVVSELRVIRSELGSQGAKYSVISRHPLGS